MRRVRVAGTALLAVVSAAVGAACSGGDNDEASTTAGDSGGGHVETETQYAPEAPLVEDYGVNPNTATTDDNQSTFALDVDTGSYTISRNYLNDGFLPEPALVRTEEFVNYFPQDYEPPDDGIGIHVDGTEVPFLESANQRVIRVGLQGEVVADEDRPPATLTFVVDTSGSMADAGKLEIVRDALNRLVDSLRPDDEVGIVTYSNEAELRLASTTVSEDGQIRDVIAGLEPQDSTNAEAGLRLGYEQALASRREGGINRVILLSDGVANVGTTDPTVLAAEIQQAAGDGIQLVTVGVGMGTYSDVVMEQLADKGDGFYAYVDDLAEAERLFVNDLTGTLTVVAREAKVQVTFDPANVTSYRLIGFENRQIADEEFRDDTVDGGEIGAGHTVTALYEVTLPEGGADGPLATVDVRWIDPDSGAPVERSATLDAADLASSFGEASRRLRQDVLVAAFAESLRKAPWSDQATLSNIADNARSLVRLLPEDQIVAEFVALTETAAAL